MTEQFPEQPRPNPYATEDHHVEGNKYICIEFYKKDGEQHRVWPYIARYGERCQFKGHEFINSCVRHFHVSGAFDTREAARAAAIANAQSYLAIPGWEHQLA